MKKFKISLIGLVIGAATVAIFLLWPRYSLAPTDPVSSDPAPSLPDSSPPPSPSLATASVPPPTLMPAVSLTPPIAEFKERITKKPFGIYITPATSPVQPERFTGYHTGVDIEYADNLGKIPVQAISDGKVIQAGHVSGYGGVVVIEHQLSGTIRLALYGHLDPQDLPPVGAPVKQGETIGQLGQGGTKETDGERKHLHFAILKDRKIDLRGYVPTPSELENWLDPQLLFP
ncbi:MAG: M23 family metallopeptidase [Candidatus Andersenbacteria bacterium]